MDDRQLLTFCIILITYEKLLSHKEHSSSLIETIIASIRNTEVDLSTSTEKQTIHNLKATIEYIFSLDFIDLELLLDKLRLDCLDYPSLYIAFENNLCKHFSDETMENKVFSIKKILMDHIKNKDFEKLINDVAYNLKFKRSSLGSNSDVSIDLVNKLMPYTSNLGETKHGIISEVCLDDELSSIAMFTEANELMVSGDNYTLGWQGISRMLQNKFVRGKFYLIGALPHQSKTAFTKDIMLQTIIYNKPINPKPNKKPLILNISAEDKLNENFQYLYIALYTNEYKKEPNLLEGLTPEQMRNYVFKKLKKNGWYFKSVHINPSKWGYMDYFQKVEEYERAGYEIFFCFFDYLAMITTKGCEQSTMGSDVRDLIRRVRNHSIEKNIGFVSPHQLSMDAKRLIRDGAEDFVQLLPGKGYYDKCGRLDQEVDVELFIHIVYMNGEHYLTIQRGKHRGLSKQTPPEDKYCVLPMSKFGYVLHDVNGSDTTRRKVGGGAIGSEDETPFWSI